MTACKQSQGDRIPCGAERDRREAGRGTEAGKPLSGGTNQARERKIPFHSLWMKRKEIREGRRREILVI